MLRSLIGAVACLGLWILLAFVLALPSGWVHLPLAAGAVLLAKAIVEAGARASGEP
jgi:hypothetical protein